MTTIDDLWIRTAPQLDDLVATLSGCRAIAIDTEADSLHHYAERVCLIQLATTGGAWLVDPLALPDLSPLAPIFADRAVVKVLHGGGNDIMSMRRDFGFVFRSLFDTAIAARLLGEIEVGLRSLVRKELGLELSKGSQRDDWSRRPLSGKQEAYALADVQHLLTLADRFTARLAAAGRTEWAREEFADLADLVAGERDTGPESYRKIKGAAKLSQREQAVLRELHVWREGRAAAANRPSFKIVGPETLIALAEQPPTEVGAVARALSPYPRQAGEVDTVFAAVARGLRLPDDQLPVRDAGSRRASSPEDRRRVDALRTWRDAEAARSQLEPAVVLPQRLVEAVAVAGPRTTDELSAIAGIRRWRVATWGPAVLAACT